MLLGGGDRLVLLSSTFVSPVRRLAWPRCEVLTVHRTICVWGACSECAASTVCAQISPCTTAPSSIARDSEKNDALVATSASVAFARDHTYRMYRALL